MMIIGVDYHPSDQYIALVESASIFCQSSGPDVKRMRGTVL
jgi:hypothetical protein